ncbi:MAG: hypothetical protein MJ153_07825 [Clostridia bacterium]|nr:hypothetical protein [Clostridia bacterium]
MELIDLLKRRQMRLNKIVNGINRILKDLPPQKLYVSNDKRIGKIRFYSASVSNSADRTYLKPDTDMNTIKMLSTKRYLENSLKTALKEREAIDELVEFYDVNEGKLCHQIYDSLDESLKEVTDHCLLSDIEYAKWWQSCDYEHKMFNEYDSTEYITDRGERVRSKSELLIANMLNKLSIPYRYECKLVLKNGKVIYPDFTILRIRSREENYLEHCGMMGDMHYQNTMCERVNLYAENDIIVGKQLFLTFESGDCPLKTKVIRNTLQSLFGEKDS